MLIKKSYIFFLLFSFSTISLAQDNNYDLSDIEEYLTDNVDISLTADIRVISNDGENLAEFVLHQAQLDIGNILLYKSPARERGRVILNKDSSYWIFFPNLQRSLVLSPLTVLAGNVSSSDLIRPPLGSLYDISYDMQEDIVVASLLSKDNKAPYYQMSITFDKSTSLPISSEAFSRGGVMLKSAKYNNVDKFQGFPIIVDSEVCDSNEECSVIKIESIREFEARSNWFSPNGLSRVR